MRRARHKRRRCPITSCGSGTEDAAPPVDPKLLRPAAQHAPLRPDFLHWAVDVPDARDTDHQPPASSPAAPAAPADDDLWARGPRAAVADAGAAACRARAAPAGVGVDRAERAMGRARAVERGDGRCGRARQSFAPRPGPTRRPTSLRMRLSHNPGFLISCACSRRAQIFARAHSRAIRRNSPRSSAGWCGWSPRTCSNCSTRGSRPSASRACPTRPRSRR